jgi:hypothetical protein
MTQILHNGVGDVIGITFDGDSTTYSPAALALMAHRVKELEQQLAGAHEELALLRETMAQATKMKTIKGARAVLAPSVDPQEAPHADRH